MKKILLVTEYFWPEEFIINDFATLVASKGYQLTVLTSQPSYPLGRMASGYRNKLFSKEIWGQVEIFRLKTILGYKESIINKILNYLWFASFGSLATLFLPRRYHSVLIYQVGPLTAAIPGILYGKIRNVPVSIWTQDVWPDTVYAYGFKQTRLLSTFLDGFVRLVYRSVNYIFISCTGFERVLRRFTKKEMVYTPNWPLSQFVSDEKFINREAVPVFLFAGNVGKVQNLENVIKGFALALRHQEFKGVLRIVGDGSALDELKQLAMEIGVKVDFAGRKPSFLMNEEYNRASYLVLSLANDPIFRLTVPSKFQMYLSVGKPILCAAEGEVRNLVNSLDLGVDSDADSIESISKAFIALSNSSEFDRARWQKNAKIAILDAFDREKIVDSVLNSMSAKLL